MPALPVFQRHLSYKKKGHSVTVFEKDREPGGLAIGYQEKEWDWTLEKHYHHWFTNDNHILDLAKAISYPVIIKRPKTSSLIDGDIVQLDSPLTLLTFSKLPLVDRLRMAATLASLRYNPFWKPLEKVKASSILPKMMGEKAYTMLWEPLLVNKFGSFSNEVSLAWFWARVKKRTTSLAYPEGGFLPFAQALTTYLEKRGVIFHFGAEVTALEETKKGTTLTINKKKESFDRVIVTLPSFHFLKLVSDLPQSYTRKLQSLRGIGAVNVVLRLKKEFFKDNTYWLNVCRTDAPVLAIVEHTHFMDKSHYNNESLVYLGNYLPQNHPYFTMKAEAILKKMDPFLKTINPSYAKSIIGIQKFTAPFAQPVIPVNYSAMIPSLQTPLQHVYLANMQQVYPWDRGTNYAVELGKKVAELIK